MTRTKHPSGERPDVSREHETRDADFKNLMLTGAGLMGLMVFILIFVWVLYKVFPEHSPQPGKIPETFTQAENPPPTPRLQANPHEELVKLRASEDSILTSYGWSGKDSSFVRIPVERAMEILAKKGLPVRNVEERTKK